MFQSLLLPHKRHGVWSSVEGKRLRVNAVLLALGRLSIPVREKWERRCVLHLGIGQHRRSLLPECILLPLPRVGQLSNIQECSVVCKSEPLGNWKILPSQKTARWELQQVEDRWLLVVGGVAQVNLYQAEAQVFLKRCCSSRLKRQGI